MNLDPAKVKLWKKQLTKKLTSAFLPAMRNRQHSTYHLASFCSKEFAKLYTLNVLNSLYFGSEFARFSCLQKFSEYYYVIELSDVIRASNNLSWRGLPVLGSAVLPMTRKQRWRTEFPRGTFVLKITNLTSILSSLTARTSTQVHIFSLSVAKY